MSRPWSLVIGNDDVSDALSDGATFTEIASSAGGSANFYIGGARASVVAGASVTLTRNSVVLWEGTVQSVSVFSSPLGGGIAVSAIPLAAQLAQQANLVITTPTDVGAIADALCDLTPIPWGGLTAYGVAPGIFQFQIASDGLSVLALLASKNWRVQNGSATFVDATNGITPIAAPIALIVQAYPQIIVQAGLDAGARIPLGGVYKSPTVTIGQPHQASFPEVADQDTCDLIGSVLTDRYGNSPSAGSVSLGAGFQGRAGDWVADPNGVQLPIQQIAYILSAGDLPATISVGYPALSLATPFSISVAAIAASAPVSRLHGDFLISGGFLSISGLSATLEAGTASIQDTVYSLTAATLPLPSTGTVQINATPAGYVVASTVGAPPPGTAVALYLVTMQADTNSGVVPLFSKGAISGTNILPNSVAAVHVNPSTIQGLHVLPTRYSTNLNDVAFAADEKWGSTLLARNATSADHLANGDTLTWDVGNSVDAVGDVIPAFSQSLSIAASATITARFKHPAFVAGGAGIPIVLFTGASFSGSGNQVASGPISGSSYPKIVYHYPPPKVGGDGYTTDINGAVLSYSTPSTTVAPSSGTPLSLTLNQLTTPSDANGSSAILVTLTDPNGVVRKTVATTFGLGPVTFTYNTSVGPSGVWTWKVQGIVATDNEVLGSTYNVAWSGTQSYYIPGVAGGAVYILAADGSTQRTAVADDNVKFTKQVYNDVEFQITNGYAGGPLNFTLGFDISGL